MTGNKFAVIVSILAACRIITAKPERDLDFTELFPENIKCVYIVAPASQLAAQPVRKFTNALSRTGIKIKVSEGVWKYEKDAAKRARYLEEAWNDPETDLILCARGGSGSFATLSNLDLDKLRSRDIPFIGFSNISILLNGFVKQGIGRPISGPTVSTLATYPNTPEAIRRVRDTVAREDLPSSQLTVCRAPAAAVSGKPLGGHFPSLAGMPADRLPDSTGRIIFLEVNKHPFDNAMKSFEKLKSTGWLDKAAAIVICDLGIAASAEKREELRKHIIDSVTCPVFSGYSYGHIPNLLAIDLGRTLTIKPDGLLTWESYDRH